MKPTKVLDDAINRLHANRQSKAAERIAEQQGLFDTGSDTPLTPDELAVTPMPAADTSPTLAGAGVEIEATNTKRERSKLLPVRHVERDFFLCDMFDYAMKDDGVSMEAPIFTLSTKPDLNVWHWKSKDGNKTLTVTPSVKGRATALVHLKRDGESTPTPNNYTAWRLQRTELGRPAASIRFKTATPMAASVC